MIKQKELDKFAKLYDKHDGHLLTIAEKMSIKVSKATYISGKLGLPGLGRSTRKTLYPVVKRIKDVKKLAFLGWDAYEISAKLGIPRYTVQKVARENNFVIRRKTHNKKYTDAMLVAAYKRWNGKYSKMADKLGMSQSSMSSIMKKRGLKKKFPSIR